MYPTDKFFLQINLEDVQNFYKDRFIDGGSFDFAIVGDFEFETIEPLIEKYIGSLSDLKRDDPYIDHGIRYTQKRNIMSTKRRMQKKQISSEFIIKIIIILTEIRQNYIY